MARFRTDSGEVYYEHRPGRLGLTVVLAHGWGMNLRVWDDVSAWLTDAGYGVLAVDQRNCGQSDKDFTDVSVQALGADLAALVNQLNLSDVVLNGWSLGGAVVMAAAPQLGARLRGLISTGGATPRYTQADDFPHGGTPADVEGTVAALRADRVNFLQGLYSEGVFARPVSDAVKAWAHGLALQASPGADASLADLAHIDQRAILSKLAVPVLIIAGSADAVVDPGICQAAAAMAPQGELVELDGCGHAPFLEDPAAYRSAVEGFLGRLGGTS